MCCPFVSQVCPRVTHPQQKNTKEQAEHHRPNPCKKTIHVTSRFPSLDDVPSLLALIRRPSHLSGSKSACSRSICLVLITSQMLFPFVFHPLFQRNRHFPNRGHPLRKNSISQASCDLGVKDSRTVFPQRGHFSKQQSFGQKSSGKQSTTKTPHPSRTRSS